MTISLRELNIALDHTSLDRTERGDLFDLLGFNRSEHNIFAVLGALAMLGYGNVEYLGWVA